MYRKTSSSKSRGIQSTAISLVCATAAALMLALTVCSITSSAETAAEGDTPVLEIVTDTSELGFFSDIPDPPLTGETEIVYEETHYPIRRVDIASVSSPRGKPETEAEPSADTLPEEEPVTETITDSESSAQPESPTQSASVSDAETPRKPIISVSAPAVIALGSVLAVMVAITTAALALSLRKPKQKKNEDESDK